MEEKKEQLVGKFYRLTGIEPTNIQHISHFHVKNSVYHVATSDGGYVLKEYHGTNGERLAMNEFENHHLLEKQGYFFDETYLVEAGHDTDEPPIFIRPYLSGDTLKSILPQMDEPVEYLKDIYNFVSGIHALKKEGLKIYDEDDVSRFNEQFFVNENTFEKLKKEYPCIEGYLKQRKHLTPVEAGFCNGDLSAGDILLKGDGKYIIDWESGGMDDPARDIGYLTYSILSHMENDKELEEGVLNLIDTFKMPNIDFYIAERAVGTAIIEYIPYGMNNKLEYAMRLCHKVLNRSDNDDNDL